MKYGNLAAGQLDIKKDLYLIKESLEKKVITQAEYDKKIKRLERLSLEWIAATNNTSQLRGKTTRKKTLSKLKDEAHAVEVDKIRQELIKEDVSE